MGVPFAATPRSILGEKGAQQLAVGWISPQHAKIRCGAIPSTMKVVWLKLTAGPLPIQPEKFG